MTPTATYTLSAPTELGFDDAVALVRATLQEEGFGVLTEIDARATLKAKLGIEISPYLILGACNPPYAHEALTLEPELGALLPCNVVVYTDADGGTRVSAIDPVAMLGVVGRPELDPIAAEIKAKLERALTKVWEAD
jgi:uncharacterized protein (DUF302 family)